MHTKLYDALNHKAKVKMLKEILKFPSSRKFTGRQLIEMADIPQSTGNRKLNELADSGVLNVEKIEKGKTYLFSINDSFPYIGDLKDLFRKERQMAKKGEPEVEILDFQTLKSWLKDAFDILHRSVNPVNLRIYTFTILLLKRFNDLYEEEAENLMKEKGLDEATANEPGRHKYYIPEEARWSYIQRQDHGIGVVINKGLEMIEKENDTIEKDFLSEINFDDKERLPDPVLEELIIHFSKKRLRSEDMKYEGVLGRACEHLIRQITFGRRNKSYHVVNRRTIQLMVKLLDPQPGMTVYDPSCGVGAKLTYSAQHIQEKYGGNTNQVLLYGQEVNQNAWTICKLNMLLHSLQNARIETGDALLNPKFQENGSLMKFDRITAGPPWSQRREMEEFKVDDYSSRFPYGLPPKISADWAWVQHMLASLNENGKIGVLLDKGVLFRQSGKKIRQKVMKDDLIEAVIAFQSNLPLNPRLSSCIIILDKDKPEERKGKVLFIYAEDQYTRESGVKLYDKFPRQKQPTKGAVEKIARTYFNWETEPHFSRVANLDEIEENDWNLSVPRYIDTTDPEEQIDVPETLRRLHDLEIKRSEFTTKLEKSIKELINHD